MRLGLSSSGLGQASLPTYHTAADVLEKKNGSGLRLFGWTIARTIMIAPPFIVVGVPWKKALLGAGLASALISIFTLVRISNAGPMTQLQGKKFLRRLGHASTGRSRR